MYPTMGGTAQADSMASPNLSSSITGLGAAPQEAMQQPNPSATKAQLLVDSFGNIFTQLDSLASQFPGASNEFNLAKDALKNWLVKASDSIVSEGVGNSATY